MGFCHGERGDSGHRNSIWFPETTWGFMVWSRQTRVTALWPQQELRGALFKVMYPSKSGSPGLPEIH